MQALWSNKNFILQLNNEKWISQKLHVGLKTHAEIICLNANRIEKHGLRVTEEQTGAIPV